MIGRGAEFAPLPITICGASTIVDLWFHATMFVTNNLRSVARPLAGLFLLIVCIFSSQAAPLVRQSDNVRTQAQRALRQGDYELAERLFRALVTRNGSDVDAHLGLSYTLLKRRDLQGAYASASLALSKDEQSGRACALLGTVLLGSGDFNSSAKVFNRALSLDYEEPLATAGLAMIDFYENRLKSSLRGLRRAAGLDSKEPDFVFNLAQVATRAERYMEAADAYEKFLAISPRSDQERRNLITGLIAFLRYLGKQKRLYVVGGPDRVVVPFELLDSRPLIRLNINGTTESLRFILDTGSVMSVLSDRTAERLGVSPVARGGMSRGIGGNGRFEIVYGFLSSLRLGAAEVENVPVYVRSFYGNSEAVDGQIGLAALDKYLVTIDYGAQVLILTRRKKNSSLSGQAANGLETPIRRTSSGFISGDVQLEGIGSTLHFIVDTGASVSVVASALTEQAQMNRFEAGPPMRIYGAAGISEDVRSILLPNVMFGPHLRKDLRAVILNLDPINETTGFVQSGILGGNFLRNFRITLDLQKGLIRLEPLASFPKSSEPLPKSSLSSGTTFGTCNPDC